MRLILMSLLMVAVVLGCDREPTGVSAEKRDVLPATLALATAPPDAKEIKQIKTSAKEGDTVVVRGVIGGRKDPIASNRAIVTIVDPAMQTCDKIAGDTCPTPWDACCEPQDSITAASATVQVVGADGRPLKTGLDSLKGIAPLKEVIVVGRVRGPVDEKNLVIDATGIYVKS